MIRIIFFILMMMWSLSFPRDKTFSTYDEKAFKLLDTQHHDCTMLITDEEFRWHEYSMESVFVFVSRSFSKTMLTYDDIVFIYNVCREYNIDVIFFLSKMEAENSLITGMKNGFSREYRRDWAMGAGMYTSRIDPKGNKYKPWRGFRKQVVLGARTLRGWFNRFNPGDGVKVNLGKDIVYPKNAATYSLLVYTPFTRVYSEHGSVTSANTDFRSIYLRFMELYEASKK